MIDLRSDTVTRPTPAMRRAMAEAEVGDDVYGEDPTVRRLEELAAARLERQAALFVPTGTMGNQIAVHLHTHPRQRGAHRGARPHLQLRDGRHGRALRRAAAADRDRGRPARARPGRRPRSTRKVAYRTPTRLLCLENTHNLWSGLPMDAARTRALAAVAHRHGLAVHLDGARIFNAAAALGTTAAELARGLRHA